MEVTALRWMVCVGAALFGWTHAGQPSDCSLPSTGVFVSISSEMEGEDSGKLRWLVINWFGMNVKEGDYMLLVDTDTNNTLTNYTVTKPEGWYKSSVPWNVSLIPESVENISESEISLPYMATYVRGDNVLYYSRFVLRPRWMEHLKANLWNTSITDVVIPGTHDAGASSTSPDTNQNIVGRWTYTQDESLWQQLVMGARYLDMRIGYYSLLPEKFYVVHGEIIIAPLQGYIDDVVKFMKQTEEIVIFDIHSLYSGFDGHDERHAELIALLESSFSEWMAPRKLSPNPSVGDLWGGGRLIVTYPTWHGEVSDYLWKSVYHLWGNSNNLEDLKAFFYNGIPQLHPSNFLWSAMAQYTPSEVDVILNSWGGLRGAAKETNFPVTKWLRQDWWNQVNIIAMDFIAFSDVISVSVEANKIRKQCLYNRESMSANGYRWWAKMKKVLVHNPYELKFHR